MAAHNKLVPSCLILEVYAPWQDKPGFVAEQIEQIAYQAFYKSVEIGPVSDKQERMRIGRIGREHAIYVATWLTSALEKQGLDLCSLDESLRLLSVETIKRLLPAAKECGSRTIALVGGPDPGPAYRERGYESCFTSLLAISKTAADLGMSVMFEPLDRFAHKKRLIGPTNEAIALFARVRQEYPDFGFAFDTAHAALNGEDVVASLDLASDMVVNIHLSNAVLDESDDRYGDHHMMPGAPGFLTVKKAAEIIRKAGAAGNRPGAGIRIAVEARALQGSDPHSTAEVAMDFLKAALAEAKITSLRRSE
jgi:hydroxypyruvate isomerase